MNYDINESAGDFSWMNLNHLVPNKFMDREIWMASNSSWFDWPFGTHNLLICNGDIVTQTTNFNAITCLNINCRLKIRQTALILLIGHYVT